MVVKNHRKSMYEFNLESVFLSKKVSFCRFSGGHANNLPHFNLFLAYIGVYYNGPKFKYQLLSVAGWFSYKIWTKNSKTPIVNLLKNIRPFQNYIFKIQWKIHFLNFKKIGQNSLKKKFRIEIWTFSFQICFGINYGLWEAVKLKIHVYAYYKGWTWDQLCIRRHPNKDLKWTELYLSPIQTRLEAFLASWPKPK